jgi:hypothetical protein
VLEVRFGSEGWDLTYVRQTSMTSVILECSSKLTTTFATCKSSFDHGDRKTLYKKS